MDIQKKPTLAEKQAFWAEQLPNFEAAYWLPSHFEFVVFDMNQGNYVIKEGLGPDFEDDATEIWHRVNTGWTMWKKAINFSRKKAQAVPEGFVLVKASERDREVCELIDERDHLENQAEQLKDKLQNLYGVDFGEHSNCNFPFQNAIDFDDSDLVLVPKELSAEEARKHAETMFNKVEQMARYEQRDLSESEFESFKNRWLEARTLTIQFDWKAMIEAQEPAND